MSFIKITASIVLIVIAVLLLNMVMPYIWIILIFMIGYTVRGRNIKKQEEKKNNIIIALQVLGGILTVILIIFLLSLL